MDDKKEVLLKAVFKVLKALPEKELRKLVYKNLIEYKLPQKRGRKKQPLTDSIEDAFHLVMAMEGDWSKVAGRKVPLKKEATAKLLIKHVPTYSGSKKQNATIEQQAHALVTKYRRAKKLTAENPFEVEKYLLKVLNDLAGSTQERDKSSSTVQAI